MQLDDVVAPVAMRYRPAAQVVHDDALVMAAYCPKRQREQDAAVVAANKNDAVPVGQPAHDPRIPYVPGAQ